MSIRKSVLGALAALIANVIFGFSFLFSKIALNTAGAHPLIILAVRFTAAFLCMNILWLTGMVKINLRGKKKGYLVAMAIAQPLVYFICELYGLSKVSSALSGVIIAMIPVVVMLFSAIFLKERPTAVQVVFTVLSIAAVSAIGIISNDGTRNYRIGILLLIGAVISASVFNVLSRFCSAGFTAFERTYMMFLIGSAGFTAIAAAVLRQRFLPELMGAVTAPSFWVAIGYLAVLSSVVAYLLYNFSTTHLDVVRCTSFSNIITVVTVLAGIFILHEELSRTELLLCGVIIIGVFGVNYRKKSHT